ncbi:hypothetical protein Tco_1156899 [Tanacetum coccineum]
MAPVNAVDEAQLFLDKLELGVTGTIVLMFCRMWDVYAATGRYLSTDFVVCDSKVKNLEEAAIDIVCGLTRSDDDSKTTFLALSWLIGVRKEFRKELPWFLMAI